MTRVNRFVLSVLTTAAFSIACVERAGVPRERNGELRATPQAAVQAGRAAAGDPRQEDACNLLADPAAMGESWEKSETIDIRFDPEAGVSICGAVYGVRGWPQNQPASGPALTTETIYLPQRPTTAAAILELAGLKNASVEVAPGQTAELEVEAHRRAGGWRACRVVQAGHPGDGR